jgi:signal transduction histidine kinase
MQLLRSPKAKLLASLFKAPEVSPEQQADRIRFMERDVCLTIKVIVLSALAYFLLFSDWFEGVPALGETDIETVRSAFRAYLAANVIIGAVLLAMDYLPVMWVQWAVFVINIVDGAFVSLLLVTSGGLESTIYWVFLVLVIRNSVSITGVRLQIAVNLFIILCYLLAGLLDLTLHELKWGQEDNTIEEPSSAFVVLSSTRTPTNAAGITTNVPNASPKAGVPRGKRRVSRPDSGDQQLEVGQALLLAITGLADRNALQSLLSRVLLLLLLAVSCYGINVLADLQLQAQDEAHEFDIRQEQLRSTGRLAAEIAHQLKNPLSIINNAAFSLQKSLGDAKPAALQQLEMIREEVGRSDRILTELMGYAQLAEGRVERLDVREEVDLAIQRAFPSALQHEVKLTVNCAQGLPPLLMQRAHLREALVNLLANARDALNSKGAIDVNVRIDDRRSVVIAISDNGPGIPDYQCEQIFEPYFSTKEKGTGLGLAIVRHNTEIYGGRATVESTLGKGTTFTLVFPAKTTMTATA